LAICDLWRYSRDYREQVR